MGITKESLLKKRKELEDGKAQLIAGISANDGAIEIVNMLLAELDKKAEPTEDKE